MVRPSLLVIRSPDVERSVQFYRALGLVFDKHAHGKGPEHFASECEGFVFEIYPASASAGSTLGTRIGFTVASVDETLAKLAELGISVVTPPSDSPWGRRAVVDDFDGHRVELLSASTGS